MRNKDVIFVLFLIFWLFVALGSFIFTELGLSAYFGINVGAILFFILYFIAEQYMPNFRNWSNFKF